ncbi:hypothetical protein ACLOJK_024744 [Asimina triloba]
MASAAEPMEKINTDHKYLKSQAPLINSGILTYRHEPPGKSMVRWAMFFSKLALQQEKKVQHQKLCNTGCRRWVLVSLEDNHMQLALQKLQLQTSAKSLLELQRVICLHADFRLHGILELPNKGRSNLCQASVRKPSMELDFHAEVAERCLALLFFL